MLVTGHIGHVIGFFLRSHKLLGGYLTLNLLILLFVFLGLFNVMRSNHLLPPLVTDSYLLSTSHPVAVILLCYILHFTSCEGEMKFWVKKLTIFVAWRRAGMSPLRVDVTFPDHNKGAYCLRWDHVGIHYQPPPPPHPYTWGKCYSWVPSQLSHMI